MQVESAILVLPASIGGAVLGLLVFWNRRPGRREGKLLRVAILVTGSVAFSCSLWLFSSALGSKSPLLAITVTLLVAAWTGMLQTILPLPLPARILKLRRREVSLLRAQWSGVRLFGRILRGTPLRRLGGTVYLAEHGADPVLVVSAIRDAEAIHAWSMLFSIPWLAWWIHQALWLAAGSSLAVHLALNVYPILHLRLARARIEKCAVKLQHEVSNEMAKR
jgi:hypothetical protein